MQTENRNMQTDCSTIIAWELLIKDSLIFIVYSGACLLCVYKKRDKYKLKLNKTS